MTVDTTNVHISPSHKGEEIFLSVKPPQTLVSNTFNWWKTKLDYVDTSMVYSTGSISAQQTRKRR